MTMDKQRIISYLQNQIAQSEFYANAHVFNERGERNPIRDRYEGIKKYIDDFLSGNTRFRWIIIPGIRGVGKTTLLSQLHSNLIISSERKLFLSIDHAMEILQTPLINIFEAYEEILGSVYERLNEPVVVFLDEVHYDKRWGVILKTIYDRTRKVLLIVTGSSALSLQTNADVARRAVFEPLYPMSFCEFIRIKQGKKLDMELSENIKDAILHSSSAKEAHKRLKMLESRVIRYWTGIDRLEFDRYLKFGSLPFALNVENEGIIYDQISKMLERVIYIDMPQFGNLSNETVSRVSAILYGIVESDVISLRNLSEKFGIHFSTLIDIMTNLERSGILIRVYPYGSTYNQVRKPSKYLFACPAFRSMYFNYAGRVKQINIEKGRLVEDLVGMYFIRMLQGIAKSSLTYDSAQGGADFILQRGDERIIVETGYGEKDFKQANKTMQRISAKYGLNISSAPLSLNSDKGIVNIPFSYFLLTIS